MSRWTKADLAQMACRRLAKGLAPCPFEEMAAPPEFDCRLQSPKNVDRATEIPPAASKCPSVTYFSAAGLPRPLAEYRFHPSRKWRFDLAWPKDRVALEIDGAVWVQGRHTRGSGYVKDMEKFNAAAALGWRVLKVQPRELFTASTVELIRKTLAIRYTP